MRITRYDYEKARSAIEAVREQLKIVKMWEEATRRIGDLGTQRLMAITIDVDGTIKTECELVHVQRDRNATQQQSE